MSLSRDLQQAAQRAARLEETEARFLSMSAENVKAFGCHVERYAQDYARSIIDRYVAEHTKFTTCYNAEMAAMIVREDMHHAIAILNEGVKAATQRAHNAAYTSRQYSFDQVVHRFDIPQATVQFCL